MPKIPLIQIPLLCLLTMVQLAGHLNAQIRLPRILRDSMVLQRDASVKIWGWASANEKIILNFNRKTFKAKAGADGNWSIILPPVKAGGPYTITLTASNTVKLKDILFGDVWFCSGQSNMLHQLNIHDVTYSDEIAKANYPQIRQFLVPVSANLQGPDRDVRSGVWQVAVGEQVRPFSAVAYFFAKRLYEKYHVPIGIINASVGGTPIEAWTSEEGLQAFTDLREIIRSNKDTAHSDASRQQPTAQANNKTEVRDKGLMESPKWYENDYNLKGWHNINIPGFWEDQGIKDFDGVVWYRRIINMPAAMAGKPAKLFMGRIVDADQIFINGKQVGATTYQYPQRRYPVPANLLKAKDNIFVIRVSNNNGKGGFVPDKPYYLFSGSDTIDLKGTWQYKVGEVYSKRGPSAVGLNPQSQPAALYNAMVAPVIYYTIKGFLWYQGETNTGHADAYQYLQAAMIKDWRHKWSLPDLPFLYVQLPGFMDYNYSPSESDWALLRDAQLKSLSVTRTAMVVAIDLGEWNDIHPDNKKDVGERLALAAQKMAYGDNLVYSGPIYKSAVADGNKIIISFDHVGGGLITRDGEEISDIAIAETDKKFVWAKAKIEGDKIIVWSDDIKDPRYVRYAWSDNPLNPNLINKEGLPASPFRTDNDKPTIP